MKEIKNDRALDLQIIVTGNHLLSEFGLTFKEIINDGFRIDDKADILLRSDDELSIIKSVGRGCILLAEKIKKLKPDLIVIFGDRFELLSVAISALILKIPLVHLSGGELTEGVIDDAVRHAITKMSTFHFPATEAYRKRIIQMGEDPRHVFNYGHLGMDNVRGLKLLSREGLEKSLNFRLNGTIAIITYHPVTLENNTAGRQIGNLLKAIRCFKIKAIFTKANCDSGGRVINQRIKDFCNGHKQSYKFFDNLGRLRYLSCLKYFDVMVGNSSSGLYEAPSFYIPVVNIGDRQKGRLRAKNIIDVGYSVNEIKKGISKALSEKFQKKIADTTNPYGKRGVRNVAYCIKNKLKTLDLDEGIIKKRFFNIDFKI